MVDYIEQIRSQFNERIKVIEKRPGVHQIIAPFFHEDGDLIDIYIEKINGSGMLRISDHAMTLMRLSYDTEVDTPNKKRIFQNIVSENKLSEENGRLFIDTPAKSLYSAMMQFTQGVAKVSNMRVLRREFVRGLFYEMFGDFVENEMVRFKPEKLVTPIPQRDDLEVDYALQGARKPIYLFGIRDNAKARIATIACLEFQKNNLPFTSIAVHEDFDALSRKDRNRVTNAADKQFTNLEDFREAGPGYIDREAA